VGRVVVPKTAETAANKPLRYLHLAASALALAASLISILTQVVEHFSKKPTGKDQRTSLGTALLGLSVLRMAPGIIRSARMLADDVKGKPTK